MSTAVSAMESALEEILDGVLEDFKRSFFSLAIGPGGECCLIEISSSDSPIASKSDELSTLCGQLRDMVKDSFEDATLLDNVKVKLREEWEWESLVEDLELVPLPLLVEVVDDDGVILALEAVRLYSRAGRGRTTFDADIPSLENRGVVA